MDIYEYVDNYGIYDFNEKEINEVDMVLFTYLSYINYENVIGKEKITLSKAARIHQGLHKKNEKKIIAVQDATKLLYYIKDLKRYKNCLLYNYKYEEDDNIQFGVLTIEYQKDKIFISYEGTNERISGWKENFILSYNYPTRSHMKAIDYLNHHYTFSNKKIIIGGHSKGGNFALVAGMNANIFVRSKIEHIYNIDGPGLLRKQFNSNKFKRIIPKYTHIIPDDSLIGILLNSTNYQVVKTNATGPLAHHIFYWEIEKDKFKRTKQSRFSQELSIRIEEFVEKKDREELENVVNEFSNLCDRAGIKSLLELKGNYKKIIELLKETTKMDKKSEKSIQEFIGIIVKAFGETKYNEIKDFIKNIK